MAKSGGRRPRRVFSEEFRTGAVRLVLDEGKPASAVARDLIFDHELKCGGEVLAPLERMGIRRKQTAPHSP